MMDDSTCTFLSLPLELRQQIYELCFSNTSEPEFGLLGVNRSIHHESLHVLNRIQTMFSFNIAGRAAGFDRFTQWCFKLKGCIPDLSEMEHINLNIYPPNQIWPTERWNIWMYVLCFCEKLKLYPRIHQLTVNFVESENLGWNSDGALPYGPGDLGSFDVVQILAIFASVVNNVEDATINLPDCHKTPSSDNERWAKATECLMTGKATDNENFDDSWLRRTFDQTPSHFPTRALGLHSKAAFRRIFGQAAILSLEDYEKFDIRFPCMKTLFDDERPRCRRACPVLGCRRCDSAEKVLFEIEFPDPALRLEEDPFTLINWHASTVVGEGRTRCPIDRVQEYDPLPINLPDWCHGLDLDFRLFPERYA